MVVPRLARIFAFAPVCAALALAQSGTTTKPKPEDYPMQLRSGTLTIAAEYMLATIADAGQSFVLRDYLVVEVAVYPAKGERWDLSSSLFTLRLNGGKRELSAATPGMVAASLKYGDWEDRSSLEVGAGPVIIGRPRPEPRFPGDRRPEEGQPPGRTRTTTETGQYGDHKLTGPEAAVEWAFPDGPHAAAASGFLYFPFKGRTKSLRSIELILHYAGQSLPLKLF